MKTNEAYLSVIIKNTKKALEVDTIDVYKMNYTVENIENSEKHLFFVG